MAKVNKLLWMDLEMTGLDVIADRIVEVAAIVTDLEFNPLDTYHAVVKQPEHVVMAMNAWSMDQHKKTGLTAEISKGKTEEKVEQELIELAKKHFRGKGSIILAGNSIHFDRRFIANYWREFEELLHYRMLDVSSYKILMENRYNTFFDKKENHRALEDVEESIAELQFYLAQLKG